MVKKTLFAVLVIIFCTCYFRLSLSLADVTPELIQNSGIVIGKNLISARLKDIPLSKVFSELKKNGNIQVKGGEEFNGKKVTIDFKNLKIDKGISRLLSGLNYYLISDSNGTVKEIVILGETKKSGQSVKNIDEQRRYINTMEEEKIEALKDTGPDEEEFQEKLHTVSSPIPVDMSRINKPPLNIDRNDPGISSLLKKDE